MKPYNELTDKGKTRRDNERLKETKEFVERQANIRIELEKIPTELLEEIYAACNDKNGRDYIISSSIYFVLRHTKGVDFNSDATIKNHDPDIRPDPPKEKELEFIINKPELKRALKSLQQLEKANPNAKNVGAVFILDSTTETLGDKVAKFAAEDYTDAAKKLSKILPSHYTCEPRINGVHCHSEIGIDENDPEQWNFTFKAIKKAFGERFVELFHQTCTNHVKFTVYLQ